MKNLIPHLRSLIMSGVLILSSLFVSSVSAQTLFSVAGSTNKAYWFTPGNATLTDSFTVQYSSTTLTEIEASLYLTSGTPTLYFMDGDDLYAIANPTSSTSATQVKTDVDGSYAGHDVSSYTAMAINSSGDAYIASGNAANDHLLNINLSTGAYVSSNTVDITNLPAGYIIEAMEFDPVTDVLYAVLTASGENTLIGSVDLGTGEWTENDQLLGITVTGLTITASGDWIAITSNNLLLSIDPESGDYGVIGTNQVYNARTVAAANTGSLTYNVVKGIVWNDEDVDGVIDISESIRKGVEVFLLNASNVIVGRDTTNSNGEFTVASTYTGSVTLEVKETDYPIGTVYPNFPTGQSYSLSLSSTKGTEYLDNNFRYWFGLKIAGQVYWDENKSGDFENPNDRGYNEDKPNPDFEWVLVELYDDDNCDGSPETGQPPIAVVDVDSNGEFVFTTQYDGDATSGTTDKVKSISGPTDDAVQNSGNVVDLNADTLVLGGGDIGAMRFKNMGLSSTDKIVDARFRFISNGNYSGYTETNISFELADASAISSGGTADISGRLLNSTSPIKWSITENWSTGDTIWSPNVAVALQEAISYVGTSGNPSFMAIFDPRSISVEERAVRTKDYGGTPNAPFMVISYTDGTGNDCYVLEVNIDEYLANDTGSVNVTEGSSGYTMTYSSSIDTTTHSNDDFGLWGTGVPVTWMEFTADKAGTEVVLNWATAQEINNDFFTVEHSVDGINFTEIGIVRGAGNSENVNKYSFLHHDPIKGMNYYRIKQTDYNGMFDYSKVAAVNFGTEGMITLNPNPVKDNVVVNLPKDLSGDVTIKVTDLSGKILIMEDIDNNTLLSGNFTLDVKALRAGTYFVTVGNVTKVHTSRIIKN